MHVRTALAGDQRFRTHVVALGVSIPVLASVAFLFEYDAVLTPSLLYVSLLVALYAGWTRAGLLAGTGAVFLAILWRFVFPPLVGYLRWSWETRYTPPRALGYKLDPPGELYEGITHGPLYALGGATVLGGSAYLLGALARRLETRYAADN
ncbi:hypothetical protein CV102_08945 [Natronococcus pandeyae]|uniref:Uncharacterized protein n=1 Tax=Natronococcus pandeyae TaxID=2055836 RepID=A0A8J8TT20_9EURY|nr:hypothetical protein [Natronococcus pandeyae]TYL39384.1 hypothetical protein CV102_08945 [Natronococcus pandeyae]